MHPILVRIGPFNIYSYGVMIAITFGIVTWLICRRSRRFNLDPDIVVDLVILLLVCGIIGARLLYVALNYGYYFANPLEIINLSRGGLIWYGGFFSSLPALLFYLKKKNLDFWAVADLIAPYLALGQAIGRIGCLLNGCCYGIEAPSGSFWAVTFPQDAVMRHPVQIYSSIALLAIFIVLRMEQDRPKRFFGRVFLSYCFLYSAQRFLMEFLRGDNSRIFLGLTMSQVISIAVILISSFLLFYKSKQWQKESLSLK